jgi:hypothetical protein
MSNIRNCQFLAVASTILLTGLCNYVALADSEASYQSSTLSGDHQSSSENGHIGESENNHQSSSQAGTGSTTTGSRSSSSEATHETPNPGMAQPSISGHNVPSTLPPTGSGTGAVGESNIKSYSHNPTEESFSRESGAQGKVSPSTAPHRSHVPQMRTTTYNWGGKSHRRHRLASTPIKSSHGNHNYMVQTIHQAAAASR